MGNLWGIYGKSMGEYFFFFTVITSALVKKTRWGCAHIGKFGGILGAYGKSMGNLWEIYGRSMGIFERLWGFYGRSMGAPD